MIGAKVRGTKPDLRISLIVYQEISLGMLLQVSEEGSILFEHVQIMNFSMGLFFFAMQLSHSKFED